jgi:hypothetical protein
MNECCSKNSTYRRMWISQHPVHYHEGEYAGGSTVTQCLCTTTTTTTTNITTMLK